MAELDSVLRPTDAFVDLAVLADQVVALIRRRATGVILRVPLERPLAPVARAAWNALATPPPSDWSLEADLWPLRLLHAALIGPLMEHLHGVSRLIISPHGSLHRVPFATLHDGAAFLGEQFEMIQVPSAAHFVRVRIQPGPYVMDALTLADSGPEWRPAQVAGEALLANFTAARVQRLDASTLSSERAVSFATGAAIVHCSLRGFIDPDFPLCSPLFLGRGVADAKAALCPHHFLAEPAHPVLVVVDGLSSEPGSEASDGEHVNPTLAFLTWGAANVVATAWRAPAAVIGDLFSHFYSAWRTQPVPRALQSAQRLMLENPATSHPHFWGAPICAGEGHTSLAGLRSLGLTPKAE